MSDDVLSPCVSVCTLNLTGEHCVGCFRTLQEIGAWAEYDDETKRDVLERVAQRRREILGELDQ